MIKTEFGAISYFDENRQEQERPSLTKCSDPYTRGCWDLCFAL